MRRLVALVALICACGGVAQAPGQAITIANDVSVVITPPPDQLPFNPRAARIQMATAKLNAEAGHPITLEIDQALVPPYRSGFEEEIASAIENIAIGLGELKRSRPDAFSREVPRLARVECRYDATAPRADASFVVARGAIVIVRPPSDPGALVPEGFVSGALESAFDQELESQYASTSADKLSRAEWAQYFEWVTGHHPRAAAPAPQSREQRFANDERAVAAVRVAALSRVVGGSDAALAARIDDHLARFAHYLSDVYDGEADLVRASPPASPFRAAEKAWAAWANARLSAVDPAGRLRVAEALFHGGYVAYDHLSRPRGENAIRGRERFPGFDALAFGLSIVDAWVAAGHPKTGDEHDARFEIMRVVVCPLERDARGKLDSNRGCENGFVKQGFDDESQSRKLADAIAQRNDGPLLESVVGNAGKNFDGGHLATALLAALAPHPAQWRAMMIELVEELDRDNSSLLKTEAQRVWAASPERRGTALYVLARLDRSYDPHYTNQWWADFPKKYGGPVDAVLFSQMLDQSPRAMQVVSLMWPALAPGFSRADAIGAHLTRFLEEPMIRDDDSGEPARTLRAIVSRFCEAGAGADMAKLHAAFVARATKGNERVLESLVLDTTPGHCRPPKVP